jgi:hypothetical protein
VTVDWRSTPRRNRARPGVQLTISRKALAILERLAAAGPGSKSAVVEAWLLGQATETPDPK